MKLIIGKPIKKQNIIPKNQYKFRIDLMGGDADADFVEKVMVDADNPYLDRFITFLENCKKKYPHGKGGYDDYNDVEDYWLFCSDEYPDEFEIDGQIVDDENIIHKYIDDEMEKCGIGFEWKSNYEYFGISSFEDYTVTYFDENGVEYKVNKQE